MPTYAELRFVELVRKPDKSLDELQEMQECEAIFQQELKEDVAKLYTDLGKIGVTVNDIWDLVNTSQDYSEAVPVLIKHLGSKYHVKNREAIVRSLSVKEARGIATPAIIEEIGKLSEFEREKGLDWVMYNTILHTAVKSDVPAIIPIVLDKKNGLSRFTLVQTLGKIKTPEGEQALVKLIDDEEMAPYAIKELGKLKSQAAKTKIENLVAHKNKSIASEAQKALKRIG